MDNDSLTPPLPPAAETVLTFLQSVGRRSEAELYLMLFRQLPKASFAIVVAEVVGVRDACGTLAEQLHYLSRLGLYAPMVLGLLDPTGASEEALRMNERLSALGVPSRTHRASLEGLADHLRIELENEVVPLVVFDPADGDQARRFDRLAQWALALKSRKVVVARRDGGLGPRDAEQLELGPGHTLSCHGRGGISVINLMMDAEPLVSGGLLTGSDATLFGSLSRLLLRDGFDRLVVNVTSPLTLLTELFTMKGAGTLLKRGTDVECHPSYASVDRDRLRDLLESSFHRRLVPGFFERPLLAVYLQPDYRGAAIVEPSPVGPLLSKFAVDPVAQGEGMGRDLWQRMVRDHRSLIWRARKNNPINAFYQLECDGMVKGERWELFWRRVAPDQVPDVVRVLVSRPEDFI